MMEAVLSNSDHPEFGEVTIPLPIPREQYDHCIELVNALEIGSVVASDCHVNEICKGWPVFYRLEGMQVNLDELDYLAKRLESFDVGEYAQFQAMTEKLDLTSMKDLINLTFCCQQATVITDFSDLAAIGHSHYLNTHGGCVSTEELEHLDGEETAILLIEGSEGTVTRYGVVYDNGMQLSQLYDGKHLPGYHYEADMIMVGLVSRQESENTKNVTWIYLPASKGQIERAIQRSGIVDPKDMCFRMGDSMFPEEVDVALDFRCEDIYELNELAQAVGKLSHDDCIKLGAAVSIWRCVSRLDYGTKYCHNSPTLDEEPLQRSILAAINSVMSQKSSLIRQITAAMEVELAPVPGESMSLADIEQRLNELNDRTRELVAEAARTKDAEAYTTQLREIMNEAAELKEKRAYIEEQRQNNAQAVQRIEDAAAAMEQASCHICEWDETLIRQLVDTVKVHSAEKITVYLRGGVQVDQDMI